MPRLCPSTAMRKRYLCRSTGMMLLFLGMAFSLSAQRPPYTQYIFNGFLMNSAVAGVERYVDVKLGLSEPGISGMEPLLLGSKGTNRTAADIVMGTALQSAA